jgi:hypothetical protein
MEHLVRHNLIKKCVCRVEGGSALSRDSRRAQTPPSALVNGAVVRQPVSLEAGPERLLGLWENAMDSLRVLRGTWGWMPIPSVLIPLNTPRQALIREREILRAGSLARLLTGWAPGVAVLVDYLNRRGRRAEPSPPGASYCSTPAPKGIFASTGIRRNHADRNPCP